MKKASRKWRIALSNIGFRKRLFVFSMALVLMISFFPGLTASADSTYWTSTTFSNLFHTTRYITIPRDQAWCIKVNVTAVSPANSTLGINACSKGGTTLYSDEYQITGTGTVYVYLYQPTSTSNRDIYLRVTKRSSVSSITCAGTWENVPLTTTVTLNKNGGTGGTDSVTATFGSSMPTITPPNRTGHAFQGYFDATSGGKQYYYANGTSANTWDKLSDTTLYARWTANQYTVSLNKNGGTGGTDSVRVTYGSPMPSITPPNRTGHTFQGYFDATSGGKQYYYASGTSASSWDKASDATLYARWTPNQYTVTFNKNGGTGGTDSVTATYGSPMPTITPPTYAEYIFQGYFDGISGGKQYYYANGSSANTWDKAFNSTLFAKWNVKITWDADGGTVDPPYSELPPGGVFGNLPEPDREECNFRGWYEWKYGTGAGPLEPGAPVPLASTPYYAKWGVEITWDPQDSTVDGSYEPFTTELTVGSEFSTNIPKPDRPKWYFEGWRGITDSFSTDFLNPSSIVHDKKTTYVARWTAKIPGETIVIWNPNGGSVLTVNELKKSDEKLEELPYPEPKKYGYTFNGWYDSEDIPISGDTIVPKSDITYIAKWTPNNITITWNADGGTVSPDYYNRTYGDTFSELPEPERDGCVFEGWFTSRNGYGSQIHTDSKIPGSNTTYYAKWSVAITWNPNEGAVSPSASTNTVGGVFGTLPSPTKPGYTFVGWKDSNGVYITPTSIVPASNTTYFAGWTLNSVTITFDNDDGTEVISSQKAVGDALGTLPNPMRDGCQFAGWYTLPNGGGTYIAESSLTPASATIYYAKWTVVINWNANGGGPSQTADVKTVGTAISALPPQPSRSNYSFEGWYTSETGGTPISGTVTVPAENTTYYAHWSPIIDASVPGNSKLSLLVNVANGEIPYHEKNKGQSLYGTAKGTENYTKYTVEMGWKNPCMWCHVFVSWAANQAGLLDAKNDRKSTAYLVPKTAGTVSGSDYFKAKGQWRNGARNNGSYVPSAGDIVYFWRSAVSRIGHVGIVTNCANGYVYTIEGNASNQVQAKRYLLTDKYIVGYGHMGGNQQSLVAAASVDLLAQFNLFFNEYVEDEPDLELRDIPDENNPIHWVADFPDAWKENCVMMPAGDNEDTIKVSFTGESKLSKGEDGFGIEMFLIIDENTLKVEPDWGSVYKLGTINAATYYLATPPDFPLATLSDALDHDYSEYSEDELALIEADWHKAMEMMNGLDRAINGKGRITSILTLTCYGQNLFIPAIADPEPGVIVSGKINSYDPLLGTTIQLMQYGIEEYCTAIDPLDIGSGQIEQSFEFDNVEPGEYTLVITKPNHQPYIVQTIEIANENVDLTRDSGSIELKYIAGVSVSGKIKSYNPNKETVVKLLNGEEVIDEIIILNNEVGDQITQDFTFKGVKPGTYSLLITKKVHTDFTVNNVIVEEDDLDLTQDDREAVRIMTLLCGDINGDGVINYADLIILWSNANYLKSTESADNPLADLNGDGAINYADLIILWSFNNYLKGAVIVD